MAPAKTMNQPTFSRRFVLGGMLVSVTALHLASCSNPDLQIMGFESDGQFFTARELAVLNDVAETMIPRTDTPGAQDAEVAAVVDGLMLTWAVESTQEQFRRVLEGFDDKAREQFGASYGELSSEDRFAVVDAIDSAAFAEDAPEEAEDYKKFKELIYRVYYTSEEGSAGHVPVPGGYYGNLTLEEYDALMEERAYG